MYYIFCRHNNPECKFKNKPTRGIRVPPPLKETGAPRPTISSPLQRPDTSLCGSGSRSGTWPPAPPVLFCRLPLPGIHSLSVLEFKDLSGRYLAPHEVVFIFSAYTRGRLPLPGIHWLCVFKPGHPSDMFLAPPKPTVCCRYTYCAGVAFRESVLSFLMIRWRTGVGRLVMPPETVTVIIL